MMILPSVNINLFNSKVDVSPAAAALEEQHAIEQPTLGKVEKTRVRLGMEKNIFSRESNYIPITTALRGTPYLQAKSNGSQSVVLGDNSGTPIAVIERVDARTFKIYAAGPSGLTPLAQVTQVGKVLQVIMEGESEQPTYTIHNVLSHPSANFVTKHTIKKQGKPVASTRYGKGNSYLLTVNAGSDILLMTCLAAIADDVAHE